MKSKSIFTIVLLFSSSIVFANQQSALQAIQNVASHAGNNPQSRCYIYASKYANGLWTKYEQGLQRQQMGMSADFVFDGIERTSLGYLDMLKNMGC